MPASSRAASLFIGGAVALTMALLLPVVSIAASPAATRPAAFPAVPAATDEDLSEVVVSGEKLTIKPSALITWIRRLLGKYTFEGKVDLGGTGKPEERWTIRGTGTCVGFGVAPGVQCEINVKWPQVPGPHGQEVVSGVSDLTPAMILYAMEPDDLGIRYLQVNSKGLAEGATGYITGDTATFKTPCVNAPPGCQRITRITSESGSDIVDMQIDTELDYKLAARFNFRMRRTAEIQAPAPALVPAPAASAAPKK
jgi:hypothetical protein